MTLVFWIAIAIVLYSYLIYPVLLGIFTRFVHQKKSNLDELKKDSLPEISLIIPAYNEKDYLGQKIRNSLSLKYPGEKLKIFFVTDGSDDGSDNYLAKQKGIINYHVPERKGKIAAMNRAVKLITSPILVFTDCNTLLSSDTLLLIADAFNDPETGCFAGEKRIVRSEKENASNAGEGIYWRYESKIKEWEGLLSSTTGAAGELFAVRRELYQEPEPDTLLDDFIISMRIALKGYKIAYNRKAFAQETASLNLEEERKRKIRIAAGAWQSILRLPSLLNPFKTGWLAFQYFSHKFLRWVVIPFLIPGIFLLNLMIVMHSGFEVLTLYHVLFLLQILIYIFSLLAYLMRNSRIRLKILFVPYYVILMNLSMILGLFRYLKKNQSVMWEKAKRARN